MGDFFPPRGGEVGVGGGGWALPRYKHAVDGRPPPAGGFFPVGDFLYPRGMFLFPVGSDCPRAMIFFPMGTRKFSRLSSFLVGWTSGRGTVGSSGSRASGDRGDRFFVFKTVILNPTNPLGLDGLA